MLATLGRGLDGMCGLVRLDPFGEFGHGGLGFVAFRLGRQRMRCEFWKIVSKWEKVKSD